MPTSARHYYSLGYINVKRQVVLDHKEITIHWNIRYKNKHLLLYEYTR